MTDQPTMFTRTELDDLQRHYEAALRALPAVTFSQGYPQYPAAINALMRLLAGPPWDNRNYDPGQAQFLLDHIEEATAVDITAILTSSQRSERFGDGNWLAILESSQLEPVLARARQLVEAD